MTFATEPAQRVQRSRRIVFNGLTPVAPGEARVVKLFGKNHGTVRSPGLRWVNPLANRRKVSTRIRNHETPIAKVNIRRTGAFSLRDNAGDITQRLSSDIADRVGPAGVSMIESRLARLSCAPEIAQAMLRPQQATAVVATRQQIVEGAVGMVALALQRRPTAPPRPEASDRMTGIDDFAAKRESRSQRHRPIIRGGGSVGREPGVVEIRGGKQ